jgi:hypothetical protein
MSRAHRVGEHDAAIDTSNTAVDSVLVVGPVAKTCYATIRAKYEN